MPLAGLFGCSASCIALPCPVSNLGPVDVRCLLIDDSPEFLASAARLLESQGIDVVGCATSTREGLELVGELEPNLALVDIELGDEDGIALAQQLETYAPSVRVVLISAYDPADVSELIVESRAVGFLPKSALSADAIAALL
jgi:two-component system nitrate/nitrite response regulator NarL